MGALLLLVGGCVYVGDEAGGQQAPSGFGVDPGLPSLFGSEGVVCSGYGCIEEGWVVVEDLSVGGQV